MAQVHLLVCAPLHNIHTIMAMQVEEIVVQLDAISSILTDVQETNAHIVEGINNHMTDSVILL